MSSRLSRALAHRLEPALYYGWVIVGVVLLSNLVTFSVSVTFGLYITPLEREFGWSRSAIAVGYALGPVAGALTAPLLGMLVDRVGVRLLMPAGGLLGGMAFLLLSRIDALWQFYLLYAVIFVTMYAGVGQLIGATSVTRWFVRRRGRALGIIMMGASGGGMIFIPIQNLLIETLGWRQAFALYGLIAMALICLPGLLLMANAPEQLGQEGNPELTLPRAAGSASQGEDSWTLAQAVRTRVFWTVLAGVMMATVCVSGYFTHVVPFLESVGFTRTQASSAWSFFFFIGMIAKFLWGFVTERIPVRVCLGVCMLGEMVGLFLLMHARSTADLVVYAIVNGLLHGPFLQLLALVWGNYFGRKSIGTILGVTQPATVLAAALGPLLGGLLFDRFGNYQAFLWVLFGMAAGAGCMFLVSPPPVRAVRADASGAEPVPAAVGSAGHGAAARGQAAPAGAQPE
ncbi:MAG: MFS transporter [Candidatus Lambdaproteobacteria bacterium]|nr:MFS transporter [Candidatus Lambdaproteobacteria bacterium]